MHHISRHSVVSAYLFFRVPRVLEHSAHMLLALSIAKPEFVLSSLFVTVRARWVRIRALRVSCQFGVLCHVQHKRLLAPQCLIPNGKFPYEFAARVITHI